MMIRIILTLIVSLLAIEAMFADEKPKAKQIAFDSSDTV